jgi:hypothetical protein
VVLRWCYSDITYSSEEAKLDNDELKNMSSANIKTLLEPGIELDDYIYNIKEDGEDEKSIVSRYQEGGLEDIANQEITFKCKDYYLVDIAFYNKIIKYLILKIELNKSSIFYPFFKFNN